MKILEDTSHISEALARLLEQFKGKPIIAALLSSYIDQVQDLEIAVYDLFSERLLETAIGDQLDQLGRLVNQPRIGDDDYYRKLIKARIAINRSNGQIEEMLNIFVLVWGDAFVFEIEELQPAILIIRVRNAFDSGDAVLLLSLATDSKPGGVALQVIWSEYPDSETFTLSSQSGTLEISTDQGLANAAQTSGGYLAGIVG